MVVGEEAVEGSGVVVEDEWDEVAVALPHGQGEDFVFGDPLEWAFVAGGGGSAVVGGDEEDEGEPVVAVGAEVGPVDGSAEGHGGDVDGFR